MGVSARGAMRGIIFIISLLLLASCLDPYGMEARIKRTEDEAKANNEKIMRLQIGQSKNEVLSIMGNPNKRESYKIGERVIEFLFYRTTGWYIRDPLDADYHFTPLAFENDKLTGWGRNYYDNVVRASIEIKKQ